MDKDSSVSWEGRAQRRTNFYWTRSGSGMPSRKNRSGQQHGWRDMWTSDAAGSLSRRSEMFVRSIPRAFAFSQHRSRSRAGSCNVERINVKAPASPLRRVICNFIVAERCRNEEGVWYFFAFSCQSCKVLILPSELLFIRMGSREFYATIAAHGLTVAGILLAN